MARSATSYSSIRAGIAAKRLAEGMSAEARKERALAGAAARWGLEGKRKVKPAPEPSIALLTAWLDRAVARCHLQPGYIYNRGVADALIAWLKKCNARKPAK